MESKRKSFFNEIGFKPTIEKLVHLTAKLYLEDDNPWVVGYSGGKDSSACLQLMWRVLEKIKSENKPHHFYNVLILKHLEQPNLMESF